MTCKVNADTTNGLKLVSDTSGAIDFQSNGTTKVHMDSSGNVGIGTSSPASLLHVTESGTGLYLATFQGDLGTNNGRVLRLKTPDSDSASEPFVWQTGNSVAWQIDATERMRINSSGNVGIGDVTSSSLQSSNNSGNSQFYWQGNYGVFASDNDTTLICNRQNSADGPIIALRKNGSAIGNIGVSSTSGDIYMSGGNMGITLGGSGRGFPTSASGVGSDNQMDWGQSNYRWDDFYATNGTINTSDRNDKQSIQSLTANEMNVAKRLSSLFKTFKWNSAVEEKGDNARTHTGIIAQDVQQAFTDESLDASNYALFISSTWYENSDGEEVESGTEGATEKTRLGIRYPELLSFIQAYNDQRFTELEARITALENN